MVKAIVWTEYNTPSMHAYRASLGDREAFVIRAYEGCWFAHCTVAGHVVKRTVGESRYESRVDATRRALAILRKKVDVDLWPCGCCGA